MRDVKRKASWLLIASAIFAMSLVISACGSDSGSDTGGGSTAGGTSSESSEEPVSIALFGQIAENSYQQSILKATEKTASEMNATVRFFDGKLDGAVQIGQVQDAITSGQFDVFLIAPNDPTGIVPAVEQAIEADIEVGAVAFPIGSDITEDKPQVEGLTTSVIENVIEGAENVAKGINEACKGIDPCKTGIIWGIRELPLEAEKIQPLKDGLDPNVEIVAENDAGYLVNEGEKIGAAFIESDPDINVIATLADQMAIGAQRAVESASREVKAGKRPADAITITGYGASTDGVKEIKAGKWLQSVALIPETSAEKATELLIEAARGKKLSAEESGYYMAEISPVGAVVTKEVLEEVPDFVGQWETG